MKCDIVIPVWNQLSFTRDCVESIRKNTAPGYRLIIIDNASDDEMKTYLKALEADKASPILVIRNDSNLGFIKAVNQGIRASSAPYVCILNNDTIVAKCWLWEMVDIMEAAKDVGIVNPSSNNLGQKPAPGEPIELYAENFKRESGKYIEVGSAIGFCMLVRKELFDKIGLLDEVYGMGNFEDSDFSRRAVQEGYRCVRARGAYVYHRENSSFREIGTFDEDFKRNREIFEFRWGKPRRIAYILDNYDANTLMRLNMEAVRLARLGNWVWYFSKDRVEIPMHSNIIHNDIGAKNFHITALYRLLKRKKKFDEIFVGEERFGSLLSHLSFIHKAKVSYY
jgi:GT2 family glycosyltransferase